MEKYTIYILNDIGKDRTKNEDNFYLDGMYRKDLKNSNTTYMVQKESSHSVLAAVFDGMGGEKAGDMASYFAAKKLNELVITSKSNDMEVIIEELNNAVCSVSKKSRCRAGSTAVILNIENEIATICNVGDSRAYLLRNMRIERLTEDHTEEASYVKMQKILNLKLDENMHHRRNALTQYLGVEKEEFLLEPNILKGIKVQTGDIYMLCSDGLTHYVEDFQIEKILNQDKDIESKGKQLQEKAFSCGNADNITIILIEVN